MKHAMTLGSPAAGHSVWNSVWQTIVKPALVDGKRLRVTVEPEKRSNEQNRLLWAALTDVSDQVDWHGQKLEPAEWKAVFTAALKRQKVVPGIDGGFVVLGSSTSAMSKAELSELCELMFAFGAEQGVKFKEVE